MTATEVAERMRRIREDQAAVNLIALTVARASGCAPTDVIRLNDRATGIIVSPASPTEVEAVAMEMPAEGGDGEKPAFAKASAGKK